MQLKIADITIDEMLTPRLSVDDELVREYRQALYSKCEFPPITVVKDEKGKPIKYQIVAKVGYKAPREVE